MINCRVGEPSAPRGTALLEQLDPQGIGLAMADGVGHALLDAAIDGEVDRLAKDVMRVLIEGVSVTSG